MEKISIPVGLWFKLIFGLRKRSKGYRESGGFLLSKPNKKNVVKIVFYDQFDKTVSDSGIIQFKGSCNLFEYLKNEKLDILADIHTHPTNNTNQSFSDKRHPMIRIKGHIAIIAPNYATEFLLMPNQCSVYEYQGSFNWRKHDNSTNPLKLKPI